MGACRPARHRAWPSSPAPITASARRRPSPWRPTASTCSSPTCAPTRATASTTVSAPRMPTRCSPPSMACPDVAPPSRPTSPRTVWLPTVRRGRAPLRPGLRPRQQRQRLGRRHVRPRPARRRLAGHRRSQPRRRCPRRRADDRRAGEAAHRQRRGLGAHRRAHLGRADGLPRGGLLRCGEGGAGELHDVGVDGAGAVRHHGQHRAPAVTDTGWVTDEVRAFVASSASSTDVAAATRSARSSPGCAPTAPGS